MRIIVFAVTAFIQLVAAVFGFFILLLGLNGFSERQATPSFIFYIALGFLSALGLGAASAFTAQRLAEKPSLGKFASSLIAVVGCLIVGAVILIIGWFAALILADTIRTWK